MYIIRYLNIINELRCRIIYSISNFNAISDILNRQDRQTDLINLIKQTFLYILYAFLTGIVLFTIWISFYVVCALDNHCYSSYVGV